MGRQPPVLGWCLRYVLFLGTADMLDAFRGKNVNGNTQKADPEKVKQLSALLAKLADIYCSVAFGTAHRGHSWKMNAVGHKIQLFAHFHDEVDILIIGGGMAFTFIKGARVKTGASLHNEAGGAEEPMVGFGYLYNLHHPALRC